MKTNYQLTIIEECLECRGKGYDMIQFPQGLSTPRCNKCNGDTEITRTVENWKGVDGYKELKEIVDRQAEDEGLWFQAERITESYLQEQLRKLHLAIEYTFKQAGIEP